MVTNAEVELTKLYWEQARESASLAHASWLNTMRFQKTLIGSALALGIPYSQAMRDFTELMDQHKAHHEATYKHMEAMSAELQRVLAELRSNTPE